MAIFHYLKFLLIYVVGLIALIATLAGGIWISWGLLAVVLFFVVGDAVAGDDISTPAFKHPKVLSIQLWIALPLLSLLVFSFVWSVSSDDVLNYGQWLTSMFFYDFNAAKYATTTVHHVSGIFLVGLMIGSLGTITAHELVHRTWDPVSKTIGRWLLAFSFDTVFSIEHVYGHHKYVATSLDPATAPRGRNVYSHIVLSTIYGNKSAWQIEKLRLNRKGQSALTMQNGVIRGHLMSLSLLILVYFLAGASAALYFFACALCGKSLLEIVNYMEHYGIVRLPNKPVASHHSWNTNKRISSWAMFNLTRHSHHHAQADVPYQDLKPFPDAPMMISGYLTTILIAMIPPLWFWLMKPKLAKWDEMYGLHSKLS